MWREWALGPIDLVPPDRLDPNDHAFCSRARPRNLRRLEILRRSRLTDDNGAHAADEGFIRILDRTGAGRPRGGSTRARRLAVQRHEHAARRQIPRYSSPEARQVKPTTR